MQLDTSDYLELLGSIVYYGSAKALSMEGTIIVNQLCRWEIVMHKVQVTFCSKLEMGMYIQTWTTNTIRASYPAQPRSDTIPKPEKGNTSTMRSIYCY